MAKTIYVYDDQGTLATATVSDFESKSEAALSVVGELQDWTQAEIDDSDTEFDLNELNTHTNELSKLVNWIKSGAADFSEQDWYETEMGFTFSVSE